MYRKPEKVVICGGGIIGVSTAHYLAIKGINSVIIEENSIACGASGNAGGFLARSWCDHNEMGALARFSYDLHMKLADELTGCDYRTLDTLEVNVTQADKKKSHKSLPDWIDGHIADTSVMGTRTNTAQVHPRKLCEALLAAAQTAANVIVKIARVKGFVKENGNVVGVETMTADGKQEVESADVVVIAMGPWSGQALRWLDKAPVVTGRRAHGIVLKPKEGKEVTPHALFVEVKGRGSNLSSESLHTDRFIDWNRLDNADVKVYPRPDGTIFMCGMSDSEELPSCVQNVKVSEEIAEKIKAVGDRVSSVIAEATVERQQSCYMPISLDHFPMIGQVSKANNVFIGTGHSCWGILNGPGTGLLLAELIAEGKCNIIDLTPFAPVRLVG